MGEGSFISQIGVIFGTLIGIGFVLYLAYVSTKMLGRRYSMKSGGSKKIKIIDSAALGKGKNIMIVKAGSKTFLVGAGEKEINLISELDSDDFIEEEMPQEQSGMDFKTAFKNVLEMRFKKKPNDDKENENDSGQE